MTDFREYWEAIRRNPKRAAALGIGGVLFSCAVIWYIILSEAFITGVADYVGQEATTALKTKVTIGRVEVSSLRSVTIRDIVIFDKADEKIAEAEAAEVRFSLFALLKTPVKAINEVEIHRLTANITQGQSGRWNYEDLISEEKSENDFSGDIILRDGQVDLAVNDGRRAAFQQVNGKLDFGGNPKLKPEITAVVRGAAVAVTGELNTKTMAGNLQAAVENAALEDFLDLLPAGKLPEEVVIRGGLLEKAAVTADLTGEESRFGGKVQLKYGAFQVYGAELTGVKGKLEYDGVKDKLLAEVAVNYNDEPMNLKGQVIMQDSIITVSRLTAELLGGSVKLAGELGLSTASYVGKISAETIDLARLSSLVGLEEQLGDAEIGGSLSCDLGFNGQGYDGTALSRLTAYGNTEILSPAYGGITGERLSVSFFRTPGELKLDYLSLLLGEEYGRGEMGIEGSVFTPDSGRRYDLTLRATHFDLGMLNRFKDNLFMAGYTDITANLRGPAADPELTADVSGVRGKLLGVPFDSFTGLLTGNLSGLQVKGFSLVREGVERWIAQGTVGLAGEKKLDLRIDTMKERAENLVPVVFPQEPPPVTGEFDNVVTITGTADKPFVTGYLHLYRGSYAGYLLNGMDGDYTYDGANFDLTDFHVFSPLVDMDLNGRFGANGEIGLTAAVHDVNMARFDRLLPYPVKGHGKFAGTVTGHISRPVFAGKLSADRLELNGAAVENFVGDVHFADGIIALKPCGFRQNGGSYEANFTLNTVTRGITGGFKVNSADLAGLLAMAGMPTEQVGGRLDGTITVGGSYDNPAVSLSGTLLKGEVKGQPLSDMRLEADLLNRVITLKQFSGVQSGGSFSGSGTVELDGAVDLKLTARNIDAGIIPKLAGSPMTMQGMIDIDAAVGGTFAAPVTNLSVLVTGGGLGGSSFDRMTAKAVCADGVIRLTEATAEKAELNKTYRLLARGDIPLEALGVDLREQERGRQLDLWLSLEEADLSLLPILSGGIDWAMGPTAGTLHLKGTIDAPLLYGRLGVREGAIKPKYFVTPFTNISGEMVCDGDRIVLRDIAASLGKGKLSLAGKVRLEGVETADYDLAFNADGLEVNCPFYEGPFSGALTITPDMFMGQEIPLVSGWIDIRDVQLAMPPLSDEETELPRLLMDVDVNVGPNVRAYSSQLYDLKLEGKVHLGGTTHYPVNSGKITLNKGKFYYLQNQFAIHEGEVRCNQQGTYEPYVDLFAYTRVGRTKVYLSTKGSLGEMDFKLTSSPEMSQTEIMQLLTFRRERGESGDDKDLAYSILDMGLHMSFLGQLEDSLRDLLFLDEFKISSRDYSMGDSFGSSDREKAQNEYNVQIGKYISDKVMLKYTIGVGNKINRAGLRYDFDDRLSMSLEQDMNEHDTRVGMEIRLNF